MLPRPAADRDGQQWAHARGVHIAVNRNSSDKIYLALDTHGYTLALVFITWPEHHALTPTKFVDLFKRLVLDAKAVQTIALSALPP